MWHSRREKRKFIATLSFIAGRWKCVLVRVVRTNFIHMASSAHCYSFLMPQSIKRSKKCESFHFVVISLKPKCGRWNLFVNSQQVNESFQQRRDRSLKEFFNWNFSRLKSKKIAVIKFHEFKISSQETVNIWRMLSTQLKILFLLDKQKSRFHSVWFPSDTKIVHAWIESSSRKFLINILCWFRTILRVHTRFNSVEFTVAW